MEGTPLTNVLDDSKNQVVLEGSEQSSLLDQVNVNPQIEVSPNEIILTTEVDDEQEIQIPPAKKKYAKITNDQRRELIDSVENQGQNIKEAAKRLDMNYSSAKSICQVFKKEGRSKKKTFKQRFEKGTDSNVNLNMPNPPHENPELQKLLTEPTQNVSQQSQTAEDLSTKKPTLMELRDKLLESRVGKPNQLQSMQIDSSGTDASSISAPSSGYGGMESKSSQTNDEGRNQQGQNYTYGQDYSNNQNQQMQQGNVYFMQQNSQSGNENYSFMKINPQQQQQQQQQGYMVYQGNMQPMFMASSQPMYQNNNFQGFMSQGQQQNNKNNQNYQNNYKEQNQQQQQQQQQQAKNTSPQMNQSDNSNQNVFMSSNSNTYTSYHQNQQYMMVPVNQPQQYYMMSSGSNNNNNTYFVSTQQQQNNNNNNQQQNNNNNNMYQPMQQMQMQQLQPVMYMQSQPNYYMQSFTTTNDIYVPQQSGGYYMMGENQNQNQNQNQNKNQNQENNQGGSGNRRDASESSGIRS